MAIYRPLSAVPEHVHNLFHVNACKRLETPRLPETEQCSADSRCLVAPSALLRWLMTSTYSTAGETGHPEAAVIAVTCLGTATLWVWLLCTAEVSSTCSCGKGLHSWDEVAYPFPEHLRIHPACVPVLRTWRCTILFLRYTSTGATLEPLPLSA
jgi:hypothetical protein